VKVRIVHEDFGVYRVGTEVDASHLDDELLPGGQGAQPGFAASQRGFDVTWMLRVQGTGLLDDSHLVGICGLYSHSGPLGTVEHEIPVTNVCKDSVLRAAVGRVVQVVVDAH
jgi:hypothetical protein